MKHLDEIIPMRLQPAKRPVYAPYDFTNKKKGAAILLLSPDTETSYRMMNLPYIYNMKLYFQGYFLDRDVSSYITTNRAPTKEEIDAFNDEVDKNLAESAIVQEAILHNKQKDEIDNRPATKFNIIGGSIQDRRDILRVYRQESFIDWCNKLKLKRPDRVINVYIHTSLEDLEGYLKDQNIPEYKKYIIYSYTEGNNIHVLSKHSYNSEAMDGPYVNYLNNEMISYIINKRNPNLNPILRNYIAIALSGQYANIKYHDKDVDLKAVDVIYSMYQDDEWDKINKIIDGNIGPIYKYVADTLYYYEESCYLNEKTLTSKERKELKDSDYGLPDKKKYPMPDESHVRSAIRFFNHVSSEDEAELAKNIKKKIKQYDMKVSVGKDNRFSKYYTEAVVLEGNDFAKKKDNFHSNKFDPNRFKKQVSNKSGKYDYTEISYIDTEKGKSAGKCRVYTKEEILADVDVKPEYRGNGIATELVKDAKKLGGKYIGVKDGNDVAYHLYEKNGYKEYYYDKKNKMHYLSTTGKPHPDDKINESVFHNVDLPDELCFQSSLAVDLSMKDSEDVIKGNIGTISEAIVLEIKSTMDKNFKSKKYIPLNSLKRHEINYSNRKEWTNLKDCRFGKSNNGFAFYDKNNELVGYYNTEIKNDGTVWIQILRVMPDYQGHGISGQLLKDSIDKENVKYLSVSKNNEIAYNLYLKNGFRVYDQTDTMYFMTIDKNIDESSFGYSDYGDILRLTQRLPKEEFDRISFTPYYQDSPYVIYRDISRDPAGNPVGFLDVYLFPSCPNMAQITLAVDPNHRHQGIASNMVSKLLDMDVDGKYDIEYYIWNVHPENECSIKLATKFGFICSDQIDKYGRITYYLPIEQMREKEFDIHLFNDDPNALIGTDEEIDESSMIYFGDINESTVLNEAAPSDQKRLKKYLYRERIKTNAQAMEELRKAKVANPWLKRIYPKLKSYKGFNIFIDLSYYHSLFLKKNVVKKDRGVKLYFDMLNRMINNEAYNEYNKKTIFIPVFDYGTQDMKKLFDYRLNINIFSMIARLAKIDIDALTKAWGGKRFVFVGNNGYFTVDFSTFKYNKLIRFKKIVSKLLSNTVVTQADIESIEDEEDEIDPEAYKTNDNTDLDTEKSSKKAIVSDIIDRIERNTNIRIDNLSTGSTKDPNVELAPHLRLRDEGYSTEDTNSTVVIMIVPDQENEDDIYKNIKSGSRVLKNMKQIENAYTD